MPELTYYIGVTLDGFIAGPQDEVDFLGLSDEFLGFLASEFADTLPTPARAAFGVADAPLTRFDTVVMGRRTYDVVEGFGTGWPYGDTPVLVATTRPLAPIEPTVRAVSGTAGEMLAGARAVAGDRDVYVDGGVLIQQLVDARLVDELIVTVIPVDLGEGIPLLAGEDQWALLRLEELREFPSGVEQRRYRRSA